MHKKQQNQCMRIKRAQNVMYIVQKNWTKGGMMEVKNIHEHAGWFASYMNAPDGGNSAQGEALVECQIKKIKQLTELIETIKGELDLFEHSPETRLESVKALIYEPREVEHTSGYFKWVG